MEALSEFDKWRYICVDETVTMKRDFQQRRANFWRRLQEGKLHLPSTEDNSRQTQTDMKLIILNKEQQSGKDCNCRATQTDCVFLRAEQVQTADEVKLSNFDVAEDDKPSHHSNSPNVRLPERDEEISVTFDCNIGKQNDEHTAAAEICFVDRSEWLTTVRSESDEDYFAQVDGFAEGEVYTSRLEALNARANAALFCQDAIALKCAKDSGRMPQDLSHCDSTGITNTCTQTYCRCVGIGVDSAHKEETADIVNSHRRQNDDTMIGLSDKATKGSMACTDEWNSDDEVDWDAFEEVANV